MDPTQEKKNKTSLKKIVNCLRGKYGPTGCRYAFENGDHARTVLFGDE